MRLYELTNQYSRIQEMASEFDDELISELEKIEEQLSDKLESCVLVLRSLELESEAIKKEEERLMDRRKSIDNGHDRLKKYMEDSMKSVEIRKMKTNLFTLSIRKNPRSLQIDDGILPEHVDKVYQKVMTSICKETIKQDLKKGVKLPYARLVQGESLRIK